jgi:hypothetical protein
LFGVDIAELAAGRIEVSPEGIDGVVGGGGIGYGMKWLLYWV